ncbi:MAG: hypothetical protein ACFB13_23120 [Kiloniellaceae bacterium]
MHDLEAVGIHTGLPPGAQEGPRYAGQPEVDFSFDDFLDIINPLQHIPLVSSLYREITGDEISPHARILGDTLFGGATGFVASLANVLYESVAGEDVGETVMAFFTGAENSDDPQFAEAPAAAMDAAQPAPLVTAAGPLPEIEAPMQPAEPDQTAQSHAVPASSPDPSEAILPEAGPGMLTGQDAMAALFMDLRGSRQAPPAVPLADGQHKSIPLTGTAGETAAKSYPLPPRHIRVGPAQPPGEAPLQPAPQTGPQSGPQSTSQPADAAAANPLLVAQEAGAGGIADRMMQALDKYQAMAQQRQAAGSEKKEDRPQWKADPVLAPAGGS